MSKDRGHKDIHALAQQFAVRSDCDGVVILTKDYRSAITNYPDSAVIFLLQTAQSRLSEHDKNNLPSNVAPLPIKNATSEILKNKIFVCIDYLENNRKIFGLYDRRALSRVARQSPLSIISVKKGHSWSLAKIKTRLKINKFGLLGQYMGDELIAICGKLTDVNHGSYPSLPILAIVSQFNEVDIIEPVIKHLLDQGIDVHIVDNWSDDGSYEAVNDLAKKYPKRLSIERFPKQNTHKYEWSKILKRVTEVAKERPAYKWIISNDADEIRWSPWPGVSLQKAISFIDHVGFNVVDYTVFNFSPTKDGYMRGMDPVEFFEYGDFGHEGWHFMQLKTWRNNPKADIASSSGHLVKVPEARIFPLKFLLAHYSLRSSSQAAKKVFKDRKPRFIADEKKQGWHSHYDKISDSQTFIKNSHGMIPFSKNGSFLESYLVERLSGIGIKINKISQK